MSSGLPGKIEELFEKSKPKTKMGRPMNPSAERYATLYVRLWRAAHGENPEDWEAGWTHWFPAPDDMLERDICYVAAALADHLWAPVPRPPRSEISARLATMGVPSPPPGPIPRRIYVVLGLMEDPPLPMTACKKMGLAAFDEAWIAREGKRLTKGHPGPGPQIRHRTKRQRPVADPTFESACKNW